MSGVHLHVLDCGAATSLQDAGRRGYQRQGLSPSGPMDALAFAAANVLAGNPPGTVAIEMALAGGRFRAEGGPVRLALAGAPFGLRIDGEPVADHRAFTLHAGETLALTPPKAGLFACLAVQGGFDLPEALGSRALHLRAALGGVDGRGLRAGDRLPLPGAADTRPERCLDALSLDPGEPVRIVLGPQGDLFPEAGLATLTGAAFTVSNRADRMGYQLDGPAIAHGPTGFNVVSDATVAGSIQVPGNGRPIVLMADRQTTGGYPKIATVISADLRRIAQRRPGETVRFRAIGLDEAVAVARARGRLVAALPDALRPVLSADERLLSANVAGNVVDALSD
ncbi:5-oxoprolinase subunit C family protein [Methylobacterium trifolii]|uniref:5-oxoprolinase subunit C n=1 Tax=Methylobacterium trifolii TaxID=1003092 RepID=A0ABQ4TU50_9HYPH|nr:biotin-dependent carboxyltransferase family protein [Methylobacterium trifolii]GJE58212.1 5-oxoprolinase subunit C [Methylobacterium trifolii]